MAIEETRPDPADGQAVIPATPGEPLDQVWTIPNVLSFLRLIGVPFFGWLILAGHDVAAIILLALASLTDLLDGRIARRFNQISKLGEVLDPAADRLYIFATVIGLSARGIIPWWLLVALVGRDVVLAALIPALQTRGYRSLPVNFIGKAATFCLLYALPLILLGAGPWVVSPPAKIFGWAFALWGTYLYWWAGLLYIGQTRTLLASRSRIEAAR